MAKTAETAQAAQAMETPQAAKVWICKEDCYTSGIRHRKGAKISALSCPPHFEEYKAPEPKAKKN